MDKDKAQSLFVYFAENHGIQLLDSDINEIDIILIGGAEIIPDVAPDYCMCGETMIDRGRVNTNNTQRVVGTRNPHQRHILRNYFGFL